MRISKKNLLSLIQENLNEMPMTFHTNNEPDSSIQAKLARQDTPLKKVPFPQSNVANQNFQELLASDTYKSVVDRVRTATGQQNVTSIGTLQRLMGNAFNEIVQAELTHHEELERFAVLSVLNAFKIPHESMNIHAKMVSFGEIQTNDFITGQQEPQQPEAQDVDDEPAQAPNPQQMDADDLEVEETYLQDLQNFNLERAKRRLINAMTQGAAHQGFRLMNYTEIANGLRQIIGPLEGGADIMNLYAVLMATNDSLYWQMSDNQIIASQASAVAGKADVKFPQPPSDEEGEEGGGGEEGEEGGGGTDTLGNEINPSKVQVYAQGATFPILFHEIIKGIQKAIAGHSKFKGYNANNPRHVEYYERIKQLEDVLDYEIWDLRLGPAIWNKFIAANPGHVTDPDQQIELQSFVQTYIYKLPPKKFLSLMKEILSGSQRGKDIVSTLVRGIEKMLADQDYEDEMQHYENELDSASDETSEEDLDSMVKNLLKDSGVTASEKEIDDLISGALGGENNDDEDDEDGGEIVRR
jgi:hypothetical protein